MKNKWTRKKEKGCKVNNSRFYFKYNTRKFRHETFSDVNEDGGTKSPLLY